MPTPELPLYRRDADGNRVPLGEGRYRLPDGRTTDDPAEVREAIERAREAIREQRQTAPAEGAGWGLLLAAAGLLFAFGR